MNENKVYYQLTLRKFGDNENKSYITTFNDPALAYKRYLHARDAYNALDDLEKMRSSVELYVIDRTSQGVKQLTTVSACGYNIIDNYIENQEIFDEMTARYFDKKDLLS